MRWFLACVGLNLVTLALLNLEQWLHETDTLPPSRLMIEKKEYRLVSLFFLGAVLVLFLFAVVGFSSLASISFNNTIVGIELALGVVVTGFAWGASEDLRVDPSRVSVQR